MGLNVETGRQVIELPPDGFHPMRIEAYSLQGLPNTGSMRRLEMLHSGPEPWWVQEVSVLNETTGAKARFVAAR